MNRKLLDYEVSDRQSFAYFLELLRADFIENPNDWENKTIDDFLEAMSRYVQGIQGYYDNTSQNINANLASWRLFADIFRGAKIYE